VNSKPRLLDLFCGAGGAAVGYHRAGFDVVGVDIKPQPRYPFDFFQDDALHALKTNMGGIRFDAIHASPPCQRYIRGGLQDAERHPDLLGPTRDLLEATGLPWVIENVPGAPMRVDAQLCGSGFGLPIRRHRWFEFSWGEPILTMGCDHSRPIVGVYGRPHGKAGAWKGMLPGSHESWSKALDIDWMTVDELADAIPPDYTEFIGYELMRHIRALSEEVEPNSVAGLSSGSLPAASSESVRLLSGVENRG
jgi:DNA (cytosine-5)-methyltransferase 1